MLYWLLHALHIPVPLQEVCVFTAPLFSAFCALATYGLVKEVKNESAGLAAAAFMAAVPSYISRSVAGSFDNEAVAIFALVFTFYAYVKVGRDGWTNRSLESLVYRQAGGMAHLTPIRLRRPQTLNTGSLAWSFLNVLAYFYMVMSWGGYSFIINLIPIHCLGCIFVGKLTPRLYVAYAPLVRQTGRHRLPHAALSLPGHEPCSFWLAALALLVY